MKAFLTSLALFGLMTMSVHAQQNLPPLIPREVLFGNPERANPQISPDGRLLAYLAPHNGVLNVWIRTVGQQDDRVVTDDRKRGIRIYFWQPDSRHIIYLQDQNGDENWRVYQTSVETKQTRDLTPFERVQARIVAVDPDIPDRILVALNNRDPRLHDVYRVDLKTGKTEWLRRVGNTKNLKTSFLPGRFPDMTYLGGRNGGPDQQQR